jgi:poly(3-hydroxybutyrate) depolymerase
MKRQWAVRLVTVCGVMWAGAGGAAETTLPATQAVTRPATRPTAAAVMYLDYFTKPSDGHRQQAIEKLRALPPLSPDEAEQAREEVFAAYGKSPEAQVRRAAAAGSFVMVNGEALTYVMKVQGEPGPGGYAAFIDLHGGGNAPPQVNDQDWVVHQNRYKVPGKFFAVRAPRDTWDHFHNEYFHGFMDAMVEQLILAEDVDPNRVYIMGFSSGGYGTIQLGPSLADRFAAVACSAAATEGSRPENLRNTPFIYQLGENDTAYGRIKLAREYGEQLRKLREADPQGYDYEFTVHAGKGHGFDDRGAVGWMAKRTRTPYPQKIVWVQNGADRPGSNPVRHQRYWVAIDPAFRRDDSGDKRIVAEVSGQNISMEVKGYESVRVRLTDELVNMSEPVTISINGMEAFRGTVERRAETILATFLERKDPTYAFSGEVVLKVPQSAADAVVGQLTEPQEREAARWLLDHMPTADRNSPEVAALLPVNVRLALQVRREAPWKEMLSDELFNNYVLPYACVNEKREEWRSDFHRRFAPKVAGCKTPGEAAKLLNETIFKELGVSYHPTKRPKPDQSPSESIEAGYASCTGLTILLVNACRAVGVPARFVGTPLWTTGKGDEQGNHAGNHSWVEVWDGEMWRAIGASEPGELDACWFMENAAKADPTKAIHRIYATSYGDGDRHFPVVWAPDDTTVRALDVTASYKAKREPPRK